MRGVETSINDDDDYDECDKKNKSKTNSHINMEQIGIIRINWDKLG